MKLVRDQIPEIINSSGGWCLCRTVHGLDEHMVFLRAKIEEEADEFLENPSYEEAADILEVLKTFCFLNNLEFDTVLKVAQAKQETRGGFAKGIVLQKVGEK